MRRAVLVALAALVVAAPADARTLGGLNGARYCEIIEVHGAPPVSATVWNTIGLNRCPAKALGALDPAALADERGDTAVVLNGPRFFVMDSVSAPAGGPIERFGDLRARRVAEIDLRGVDDLGATPYVDRTIRRKNTWRWRRGRTVTELLAPGGDRYVLQSTAGSKVAPSLPPGWSRTTRKVTKPLALRARGSATVLRDDEGNTYQLASVTRSGPRATHHVSMTGATTTTFLDTPGGVQDSGTVTGTPFGDGDLLLTGTLTDGMLTATYRLTFPDGSIHGRVRAPFVITGNEIDFSGTTTFEGGTGAYRGITGTLGFYDHNTLAGDAGDLRVAGDVRY